MDILYRILEQMKIKGITQKQLTDSLGISKANFSEWKGGRSESYKKYISQIAEILNVSTDYLLGTEKSLDEQLEGIEFALWGEVKEMTDDEKQDVLDYIKFKKMKRGN